MNNIKFRAWDSTISRMGEVKRINFSYDDGYHMYHVDFNDDYGTVKVFANAGVKLLQYTRLKDKNGKEIYEGDILETRDSRLYIVIYKDEGFITEYRYNLRGFEETTDIPLRNTSKRSEVIGNIYEHSHLLEGKNEEN